MGSLKNWDDYFYSVAEVVAKNSKCYSRKIGAILVQDKSIISTGYNGPPRGVPSCVTLKAPNLCPRKALGFQSGQGLEFCPAGHAERNVLINAARNGICTNDTILYCTCGVPCKDCLIEIINAGVRQVVVTNSNEYYDDLSKYLIESSGLSVREYERK